MMGFLQTYNGAIQAVAAVFSLIFIGALSFYSHKLQKKNYSIEVHSKLQQEIKDCIGEINECIGYFALQERETSLYLHQLNTEENDDPHHADLANQILGDLTKVLISLKALRLMIGDLNTPLSSEEIKCEIWMKNISKLNSFKYFLLVNHPANKHEDHVSGAESHWVDVEYSTNQAFVDVKKIIKALEDILRSN